MNVNEVLVTNRMRSDLGDIDGLANSIREHGLIEPIVLVLSETEGCKLLAGERRLTALKRVGVTELVHAKHYIWNYELDPLKQKAIELEENLRRKELSWQEEVRGKQQLLELMQRIHGIHTGTRPKMGVPEGFSARKLSAMLGESDTTTAVDLQIADAMKTFPSLAKAESKGAAMTQLKILGVVATMHASAKANPQVGQRSWILRNEDFREAQGQYQDEPFIANESVDLIWTDLPYGSDVNQMSHHKDGVATFDDSFETARSLLHDIAKESYRVLKPDRFAVFCFGFITYHDIVSELTLAGFKVNPVPVVWIKNTKSGENPTTRYCNGYEPILVASKGSPVFIRPGQSNCIQLPTDSDRIQAVQKPVALVERFLIDMCTKGATIVDWCAGTGTTGIACHKVGMRSILFEKDASMYALAKARLEAL